MNRELRPIRGEDSEVFEQQMIASKIRLMLASALLASVTATACYGRAAAQTAYATGNIILTGTVVTMDEELSVKSNTRIHIREGRIAAIVPAGEPIPPEAEGVPQVKIQGFIYPGLINVHNHLAYNVLPSWKMPRVNGKPFNNRYEWREGLGTYQEARESYSQNVTWPKFDLMDAGLAAEVGKWAEIKELVAGTTSTQGSFSFFGRLDEEEKQGGFNRHLVRNIDLDSGGRLRQSSVGIYNFRYPHRLNEALLEEVLAGVERERIDAFLVHLSEGTDEDSREELYALNRFHLQDGRRCGPLLEKTAVIHGTPYRREEFELMAECGADLIAAPLSNLLYYGRVPNLADAVEAGVRVSLSTDWNPAGSKNLLVELKVVDFLNKHFYDSRLSDADLVRMVTSNPATSVGWGDRAGRLKPGHLGDLLVVDSRQTDPYRALIEATERDVTLVVVGGQPLYGDVEILQALNPDDYQIMDTGCGFRKAIDLTTERPEVEKGRQDFQAIQQALRDGFRKLQPGIRSRGVSPLYMCQDAIGLEAIRESANVTHFDPEFKELASTLDLYYTGNVAVARVEPEPRPSDFPPATPSDTRSASAVVKRVLDGDTIGVEYPNGSTVTVRLRGIDAPETVSRTDPSRFGNVANAACLDRWGSLAAKYVTDALTGQTVELVMDSVAGRSAFGQPLAYVHVNGEDFNAKMVAQGYARVFTGPSGGPRVNEYLRLQARAEAQAIGLWGC